MADAPQKNGKTEVATIKPIEEVRGNLKRMEPEFKVALPPQISPEKFIRVVMTAVQQNPKLLENRAALYGAAIKCATDGLLPDGKEAALVPFGATIQYMPMVAGILKKVRNSGELSSLSPHVVYSNDRFAYWIDEVGEHLKHEPQLTGSRGELTHVYAIARTKDGGVYIEVMNREQVEQVRAVSKAKNDGPWVTWYDEQARKTVIRRLSKRLPMSTDLEQVITRDDELYDLNASPAKPTDATTKKKGRFEHVIDAQAADVTADVDAGTKTEAPI